MPQTPTQASTSLNNSNQLEKIIRAAQAVRNPVAYLQSQVANSPLIKQALDLGAQYNGDYDAATRSLLQQNNIDPMQVRQLLQTLGI